MDNELKEMSFWDHVDDLRRVILRSVGAIILLSVVFFTLMPRIFDSIVLAPCHSDFILYRLLCDLSQHTSILPDFCNDHFEVKLINIQLASQFLSTWARPCGLPCCLRFHMSSINCGLSSVRDYTPAKNDMPEGHFSQGISCSLSVSEWDIFLYFR